MEEKRSLEAEKTENDDLEDFSDVLLQAKGDNVIKEVNSNEENVHKETEIESFIAKNKWQVYKNLVDLFKGRTENDNKLKKTYSLILVIILGIELVVMNVIFILKGANVLNFSDTTFNLFITATIAEVFTLVTIIVKYLFTDKLTDLLINILSDDRNDNKKNNIKEDNKD